MKIKFEPRDAWVGVFVDWKGSRDPCVVYACLVPFFPIMFTIPPRRRSRDERIFDALQTDEVSRLRKTIRDRALQVREEINDQVVKDMEVRGERDGRLSTAEMERIKRLIRDQKMVFRRDEELVNELEDVRYVVVVDHAENDDEHD